MTRWQATAGRAIPLSICAAFWADASAVERQREPSFIQDVVPILTKAGCNAGSCHGSLQGRGGLRLSLLGFDPAADYEAIFPLPPGAQETTEFIDERGCVLNLGACQ